MRFFTSRRPPKHAIESDAGNVGDSNAARTVDELIQVADVANAPDPPVWAPASQTDPTVSRDGAQDCSNGTTETDALVPVADVAGIVPSAPQERDDGNESEKGETALALMSQDKLLLYEEAGHSPTVYNNTRQSIVVVLERGVFYRPQVLHPGEAASWNRWETGGVVLSYYHVNVMVGDERSIPSVGDSNRNLLKVSVVPAAFLAGCMMTAYSGGTLAGPSAGLAKLVGGVAVRGVVVDGATIAAGGVAASRAQAIADFVIKKHPNRVMLRSPRYLPGKRFLVVSGGLADGPLVLRQVSERIFRRDVFDGRKKQLQELAKRDGRDVDDLPNGGFVIKAPRAKLSETPSEIPKSHEFVEDDESALRKTLVLLKKLKS